MRRLHVRPQTAALTLVAVALLIAGGLELREVLDHRRIDTSRSDVISVAEEQVVELTTLDTNNVDSQLKTLIGRTTGDFRDQFEAMTSTFTQVVLDGKVEAKGSVLESGVSKISSSAAQVVVAAEATVSNADSKEPVDRSYRMSVQLKHVDGAWLVSGMKFVP